MNKNILSINDYGRKKDFRWQPTETAYRVYYREGYAARRVATFCGPGAAIMAAELVSTLIEAGIRAFSEAV
jgi:hypothetical protein